MSKLTKAQIEELEDFKAKFLKLYRLALDVTDSIGELQQFLDKEANDVEEQLTEWKKPK